jgi:alkylated DNA repair dioxygenase AlkB
MLTVKRIYTVEEAQTVFHYLNCLEVEYHKTYKRFNKEVKVPRGQASYSLNDSVHYNYLVSGGSPPNYTMTEELKSITEKVNAALGTNFNTILLNKYKTGEDSIGFHKDRETGWQDNTGFATLAFGATRDFQVKNDDTKKTTTHPHESGSVLYLPAPMNQNNTHAIPKRKRVKECRISLTFREIIPQH